MAEQALNVRYDPSTGTLSIETGGPSVTVENVGGTGAFTRVDDDEERTALFLSETEIDVLLKMVSYILDKVKITEGSRMALQSIKPRLEELRGGGE